jgi:acyl carrier protein
MKKEPGQRQALEEQLKTIIVEHLGVNEAEVVGNASLFDDLGADSLDAVELVMAIEEQYDIEIPDEEAEEIRTVEQLVAYVAKAVGG